MELVLYNTSADNREIHKTLTNEQRLTGQLMEGTNIVTPSIMITYHDIANINYAYIPAFNRYYYVTNIDVIEGQNMIISLSCDVLMSFWDEFKSSQVIAERSASKYNKYIPDNMVAFNPKIRTEYRKLNNVFTPTENGKHYVLTIGGTI